LVHHKEFQLIKLYVGEGTTAIEPWSLSDY